MFKNQRVFQLAKDYPPDVKAGSVCILDTSRNQYLWQDTGDVVLGNPEELPAFFKEMKFDKPSFEVGDVILVNKGQKFSGWNGKNHYSFGPNQLFKITRIRVQNQPHTWQKTKLIFTLLPLDNKQTEIERFESDLEHVQMYYFINSSGEISQDIIKDSSNEKKKKAFEFRKKMNNVFNTQDEAKFELKKLLK